MEKRWVVGGAQQRLKAVSCVRFVDTIHVDEGDELEVRL